MVVIFLLVVAFSVYHFSSLGFKLVSQFLLAAFVQQYVLGHTCVAFGVPCPQCLRALLRAFQFGLIEKVCFHGPPSLHTVAITHSLAHLACG